VVGVFPGCFLLAVGGASGEVTDLALLLREPGKKREALAECLPCLCVG